MALNLNIGILGHVDSGKTSLAKALSEIASTAAFDKNPQSQSRGITLDLGFSAFSISAPEHLLLKDANIEKIQYTLVDCPGHASLIKTIIGGSQIIDMMLLVIDVTKGIQTQTAECLVIGEITCRKMIIVLNKIDLIDDEKRNHSIDKVSKKLKLTLASTSFADVPIVAVSVNPSADKIGLSHLIETIAEFSFIPKRDCQGPLVFAVDHCFGIKGQGTVMTGTILQGVVSVNDAVDIPIINKSKKIKSIQMFRKPVLAACQGDRIGICVTQLDPKLMERGIVCSPGVANFITCAIISVHRIKYYKNPINSKSKYHVTVGYETSVVTVTIFSSDNLTESNKFCSSTEYEYKQCLENEEDESEKSLKYFMLLEFERPVLAVENSILIGSKLDMYIHTSACRLAFWGNLLLYSKDKDYRTSFLSNLKLYKIKTKVGSIERLVNDTSVIVKNIFKKETDLQCFMGLKVTTSIGDEGTIESSFGQSGKVKVLFENGLCAKTLDTIRAKSANPVVSLVFKKFIYDIKKQICQ